MNYICYKLMNGDEEIFLFPQSMSHCQFNRIIETILKPPRRKLVSAGVVSDLQTCHESDNAYHTLHLHSRGAIDDKILQSHSKPKESKILEFRR